MLLLDYICSQRVKHGKMPADPVMVKTIVTMDMGEQIATHYGLRTINVLTGFKFIGEQIGKLEKQGKADSYVFGFEESYGYLTGSYVRDKDGVDGAYMICEMFSYYATRGISLLDKLDELYESYGYCLNTLHSYEFDGSAGFAKMQNIMQAFRGDIKEFGGKKVVKLLDYAPGLDGLPKVRRYPDGWGDVAPLTGLLYCADCGGKMYVHRFNNGKRISQYTCSKYSKIPVGTLCKTQHRINESVVLELVKDLLKAIAEYSCWNHHMERCYGEADEV